VITSKPLKGSAGSANVEMGNTRVSCAVWVNLFTLQKPIKHNTFLRTGPKEQQSAESPLEGVLNVNTKYLYVNFFTPTYSIQISLYGSIDPTARYTLEHALKAVICLKKLGRVSQ
jgi:hypothetical protein